MSRKEYKSTKRRTFSSIEMLDDRVLPSGLAAAPPTPAPAPSPVDVPRVEHRIERIDRVFLTGARHLDKVMMARAAHMEAVLHTAANRAAVQVQAALVNAASVPASTAAAQTQAASTQLAALVAATAASSVRLSTVAEHELGLLTGSVAQASARAGVPATALENNFGLARVGLASNVSTALSSIATQIQSASTAVASAVNSTTGTTSSSSTTGTSTSSTGTSTVGVTQTETFSNAVTQAFSSINTAINGVDAVLAQDLGSFNTAFTSGVTNVLSTLTTFQPTVSFVSGNGVTFTGT